MDALRDALWMRELYSSSPVERFEQGRFSVVYIASTPNAEHHNQRYRYRLFFFEHGGTKPVMAVNMESDLLGTWRLTLMTAAETRIVASFDLPPDYGAFKAMALNAAEDEAAGSNPGGSTGRRHPATGRTGSTARRRIP